MKCLGIDASNIRQGGGVTYLREFLRNARPEKYGFGRVVLWAGETTLSQIPEQPWLERMTNRALASSLPRRAWWQTFELASAARAKGCDIVFAPGGSFATRFRPVVTMHPNLLPFSWVEASRYGPSLMLLKMAVLRVVQARSFRHADRAILLSEHSREVVSAVAGGGLKGVVIPLGIGHSPLHAGRNVRAYGEFTSEAPARVVYVSALEPYKHHFEVIEAVYQLRQNGVPLVLDIIGNGHQKTTAAIARLARSLDPSAAYIRLRGAVPAREVYDCYAAADVVVFASTCEALPNILIEAMICGSAIACSSSRPMSDVLGDAGTYFDAEDPKSIATSIEMLLRAHQMRLELSEKASRKAAGYSWQTCADTTFQLFQEVVANR